MNHDLPDPRDSHLSDAEQARLTEAARLEQERQRQLAQHRATINAKIKLDAPAHEIIQYQQEHLVNRSQHATWGGFWPMVDGLYRVGPPPDPLIILGGWMRPPPSDLTVLIPNPVGLQQDAFDFGVYYPAFGFAGYQSVFGSQSEELFGLFCHWVRKFPDHFKPARRPGNEWDWEEAVAAIPELVPIKRRIEDTLLFMENQALVFHSTPDDPHQAWRDFWQFSFGYFYLREFLCSAFREGEYYLLFAQPSARPAAAPTPTATATPTVP